MLCHSLYSALRVLVLAALLQEEIEVIALIRRSVSRTEVDWQAAPHYQYRERDVKGKKVETYEVTMIEGSPYTG